MSTPYAKLPAWADYGLIPLINLLVAFIVAGLVVLLVGENPFRARRSSWSRARSAAAQGIAYTLYYATNFIFTGLAVAVAFHCGLFNIGGEGQAYIAGLGVGVVCLAFDHVLPWWLTFPLAILARGRGRRAVGADPGLSAGQARLAHRHHHHHVQLHRRVGDGLPAGRRAEAGRLDGAADAPASPKARNCRSSAGCCRSSASRCAPRRRSTSPSCWRWSWPSWSGC